MHDWTSPTAADLAVIHVMWHERRPLTVGAIVDRANVRDHQVVTLLARLCREDLAFRLPLHACDWPPSGMYRLTAAGRRWARLELEAWPLPEQPEEPDPRRRAHRPTTGATPALSTLMMAALITSRPDGSIHGGGWHTQDALVRRGLAGVVMSTRLNPHTREEEPWRVGIRLNADGLATRAQLIADLAGRTVAGLPFGDPLPGAGGQRFGDFPSDGA